jgi:hypothetical protein
LLFFAGGARGSDGGATAAGAGVVVAADWAAPHLLQNFVPASRDAPQELQNAISHLETENL